jgi:uncharacterized protein (DUF1778 family)
MINPLVDKPVDNTPAATRDVTINIRVTQVQRDLIDAAAEALSKSRSEFMLECAHQKAQDVLLDRTFFNVDEDKFSAFLDLLDEPPVYRDRLQKLLITKAPWE